MDRRTGNFARPQSIRRQHAIKGILHMIDRTGGGEITTEDQNKIIDNHLHQDTYEYEPVPGGRARRYNVKKLRELMTTLAHDSKLRSIRGGEDSVTLLFRRQSQALDPTILAKCGYKRSDPLGLVQQPSLQVSKDHTAITPKRSEHGASRGLSLTPQTLQRMKRWHNERAFSVTLKDIDASVSERNEPDYKYKSRSARLLALAEICARFRLTVFGSTESTQPLTSQALFDIVYRVWRDLKPHQWVPFDSFWREGSSCLKSDQLQRLELSCAQFALEGRLLQRSDQSSVSDTTVADPSSRRSLDTTSVSRQSPSLSPDDEITLSTPPQSARESISKLPGTGKVHSRGVKRKASAGSSPQAFNQSPVVFVPQNESFDTVVRAMRDSHVRTKRESSGSQYLSPVDAIREIQAIGYIQKTQLLWMIGHLKLTQCSCPLTPQPGHELIPLYKRCWGDGWKQGSDELLMSGKRSVIDDTTALISAFLFEQILTGAAPLERYTKDIAEDNEPDFMTPNSRQSLLLSQLSQVHSKAVTTELLSALQPYFLGLTQLSRMMYSTHSTENLDPALHSPFRKGMSEIVSKALNLRSRLDVSGMESVFFWPMRGEIYDSERMQAPVAPEPSTSLTYVVAFTTFPGLTYVDPVVGVVYKARVVLRIETAR